MLHLFSSSLKDLQKEIEGLIKYNEDHIKECKLEGEGKLQWIWFNKGLEEVLELITERK